jgi:hypothetical protein
MRSLVAAVFFFPLLEANIFAQTRAPDLLCGTVRDEVGATIPRVHLKAKRNGGSETYETQATEEGRFALEIPKGIYEITFRSEGFKKRTLKDISVPTPCIDVDLKSAVRPHNIT